jgi:hypothetical protein
VLQSFTLQHRITPCYLPGGVACPQWGVADGALVGEVRQCAAIGGTIFEERHCSARREEGFALTPN